MQPSISLPPPAVFASNTVWHIVVTPKAGLSVVLLLGSITLEVYAVSWWFLNPVVTEAVVLAWSVERLLGSITPEVYAVSRWFLTPVVAEAVVLAWRVYRDAPLAFTQVCSEAFASALC